MCEFFDIDGQLVEFGSFSLISKSLHRAVIDAQSITGMELSIFSSKFAVLRHGNKRAVVGVADG